MDNVTQFEWSDSFLSELFFQFQMWSNNTFNKWI